MGRVRGSAPLEEVKRHGWAYLTDVGFDDVRQLVQTLGTPDEHFALTPAMCGGPRKSLSALHGLGAFPFHTDGAARIAPPRYIALWAPVASDTATLLIDGACADLDHPAFRASWIVCPGAARLPFYAIPRLESRGAVRWRFNPDCMRPPLNVSVVEISDQLRGMPHTRIAWSGRDAAIIDNRRMLHAREAISDADGRRTLIRISVPRGVD